MLSTLPKLADRAFILGFFLPTLLFALVAFLLFGDLPTAKEWLKSLTEKDLGKAAYLLLSVWVMAVMLQMLSHPLYRFLEGYTLPGWLAEPWKESNRKRLREELEKLRGLFERWATEGDRFPPDDLLRYRTIKRELVKRMPPREGQVLPTDFGNAIRAFEVYSNDVYGADGVTTWLRLGTVIPKAFNDQVQDTRTAVDFLVNCVFFSVVLAMLGLGRAIYSIGWRSLFDSSSPGSFAGSIEYAWLAWTAGGLIAAYLFYRWAVARVPAWGDLVRTAFDCYLPALAKQMGYELPTTARDREKFWTDFNQQIVYRRDPRGNLPFKPEDWKQVVSTSDGGGSNSPSSGRSEGGAAHQPETENDGEDNDC
jgi:hypothetical protein